MASPGSDAGFRLTTRMAGASQQQPTSQTHARCPACLLLLMAAWVEGQPSPSVRQQAASSSRCCSPLYSVQHVLSSSGGLPLLLAAEGTKQKPARASVLQLPNKSRAKRAHAPQAPGHPPPPAAALAGGGGMQAAAPPRCAGMPACRCRFDGSHLPLQVPASRSYALVSCACWSCSATTLCHHSARKHRCGRQLTNGGSRRQQQQHHPGDSSR